MCLLVFSFRPWGLPCCGAGGESGGNNARGVGFRVRLVWREGGLGDGRRLQLRAQAVTCDCPFTPLTLRVFSPPPSLSALLGPQVSGLGVLRHAGGRGAGQGCASVRRGQAHQVWLALPALPCHARALSLNMLSRGFFAPNQTSWVFRDTRPTKSASRDSDKSAQFWCDSTHRLLVARGINRSAGVFCRRAR